VSESVFTIVFDLLKTIEIELPHKTLEFGMAEEIRYNLMFHFFLINDINHRFRFIPADDISVMVVLI